MIPVTSARARDYYKVSDSSLRRWARQGLVPTEKSLGGHYRFLIPVNESSSQLIENNFIVYARVSSKKQEADLERQVTYLSSIYNDYAVVRDIGSGLNYKRQGFKAILEQLFKGNIKRVVVAHQDRFTRFGFDFFQWLFQQFGAVLESVDRSTKSREEELLGDIMEVFTLFTARYYGSRKYHLDEEDPDLPEQGAKGDV